MKTLISGSSGFIGSHNELSRAIQKVTGTNFEPIHVPDRPQEVKEAISDTSLSQLVLNYADTVSLEEGLLRTWEYCKELGPQDLKFTKMEIGGKTPWG